MDDLVLAKLNLNVFGSNFGAYPTPPLTPLSFHKASGSYFPGVRKDTHVVDHRHEALKALLEGNILYKLRRSPQRVLDLAAGNGAWAVDVAQEFPAADEVVGVDIRRDVPSNHPANCRFETADICRGIRYPENYFSLVHSRSVSTVVQDWPRYVAEIFRVTAPGGHIQLTELAFKVESQNGDLPKESGLKVMERAFRNYAACKHYNLEVESDLTALVRNAGFHGVEEKVFSVPVGSWNPDHNLARIGTLMLEHYSEGAGTWGRQCMIEIGIPEDVADMYIEKLRGELKDPLLKLSVRGRCVTGKKPGRSRSSSPRGSHSPKRRGSKSPPSSPKRG